MRIVPRTRACRFSSARPVSAAALSNASTIGAIGTVRKCRPVRCASSAASSFGVVRGVVARHRDAVHVVGAERVAGDRRDQRRVDAAGEPEHAPSEAVLAHVVAQARDERRRTPRRRRRDPLGDRRAAGRSYGRPAGAPTVDAPSASRLGGRVGGRQLEVDDQQRPRRTAGPAPDRAAGVDDERVAVEDQLVLAADHVDVGERAAGLAAPGARTARAARRPCCARTASR